MFKQLGIPGLKPERLEVVSAIFKGDVFAILPTGFGKLFNTHVYSIIDIRGFTGLETPNELHNRGALTDAHAHAALIILMAVKGDQYSLLSRQLK